VRPRLSRVVVRSLLAVHSTSVYWTEADYINLTIYLRRAPL
jgi:hypothetical protein